MTKRIIIAVAPLLIIIAALLFINWQEGNTAKSPTVAPTTTQQIEEDEPGWDCQTMGNKRCGPINN